MKLFRYTLYLSLLFCGCADASPKEKISEFSCPSVLPAEKNFPASWVTMGHASSDKFLIIEADLISGNVLEEKKRLTGAKDRAFASEMIDDWTVRDGGGSESTMPYDADHGDIAMKCTYGEKREDILDNDRIVTLLIQLPPKKALNCLIVRNQVGPDYELSCKAK